MKTKLEEILEENHLKNHALVEIFPGELTHKTVQKARLGTRAISKKSKRKIVEALNKVLQEKSYRVEEIFPDYSRE